MSISQRQVVQNTVDERSMALVVGLTGLGLSATGAEGQMPGQVEDVSRHLRRHQEQVAVDWDHRGLVQALHEWADRFSRDFRLDLPQPAVAVAPLRIETLGRYQLGRNEFGLRTTITLNARWLPHRPGAATLTTLFHECVHAHEEWHLGRTTGGWYHS